MSISSICLYQYFPSKQRPFLFIRYPTALLLVFTYQQSVDLIRKTKTSYSIVSLFDAAVVVLVGTNVDFDADAVVVAITAAQMIKAPPIISNLLVVSPNRNTANSVAKTGSLLKITFASLADTTFWAFCCKISAIVPGPTALINNASHTIQPPPDETAIHDGILPPVVVVGGMVNDEEIHHQIEYIAATKNVLRPCNCTSLGCLGPKMEIRNK